MPKPADPMAFIKALHAAYEARTGYAIIYNDLRQRQWWEWCKWADWSWTERELAIVINYLRSKNNKGERNDGALKFGNLIGNPDKFEEDLNLANEARKGLPMARKMTAPKTTSAPTERVNSHGEEAFTGKEAAESFKDLLKKQS